MTQQRHTIDKLISQGVLPLEHTNAAARYLEVYPAKRTWLNFFDKALLSIGTVALALSLVFFIAYNWLYLGKLGKFAMVEGAMVLTIVVYATLAYQRKHRLVQQLLLLIASIITGSLLALFGQVYQTGADTWQLFFNWALLIIPWVLIARLPALWLLWLGLLNASLILYTSIVSAFGFSYINEGMFYLIVMSGLNTITFILWLICLNKTSTGPDQTPSTKTALKIRTAQVGYHWSTYVVGLASTYFITRLAIVHVTQDADLLASALSLVLWVSWSGFMYWRFYRHRIDLLMLTYLCGSAIIVVMFWLVEALLIDWDSGGFLVLALLLIGLSSAAVIWLRRVALLADATKPRGHYE